METNEKLRYSLENMQRQIEKFDNKASILIAIVGIVFAISLGLLDIFRQLFSAEIIPEIMVKYILIVVFISLYFISFVLEMLFLLLVIYPRKKKQVGYDSLSYYMDVAKMTKEDIAEYANKLNETNILVEQLSINAKICANKHKNLVIAIWLMIPLCVSMITLFFMAIV